MAKSIVGQEELGRAGAIAVIRDALAIPNSNWLAV